MDSRQAAHTTAAVPSASNSVGSRKSESNSMREKDAAEKHDEQAEDDESQYPKGLKLGLITLALCLSVFLVALVSINLQILERLFESQKQFPA